MIFEKRFNTYISTDEKYRITIVSSNRAKYHGKYCVTRKGVLGTRYASTLKEAKMIASKWEGEN